jgi:2-iminoacetate synthase ThiH
MTNIILTPEELELILDRSAKRGAKLVLRELGLHDESAAEYMEHIR